ncbi:MAG: FmdB family zinc ribbon protein [Planctomycetota bacterium]|jgi:putative FmdB family regulatory protein
MPIYEFQCSECEHHFDKIMGLNDPKPRKCPECGKLKVTRVIFPSDSPPVLHMRYSNAHPRHMRGQRGRKKTVR